MCAVSIPCWLKRLHLAPAYIAKTFEKRQFVKTSFADSVVILQPASLVATIRERLTSALGHY
jgi:hypothetical protein